MKRNYISCNSLDEPLGTLVLEARKGKVTIFLEDGDGVAILQKFHESLHDFDFDLGAKLLPVWSQSEWNRIHKDFNDSFFGVQA